MEMLIGIETYLKEDEQKVEKFMKESLELLTKITSFSKSKGYAFKFQ